MRLTDLPAVERPRERAVRLGVRALADRELLASILGSGRHGADALELAGRLLSVGLSRLARASVGELAEIDGIGPAHATTTVSVGPMACCR